jgi:3',5'-cyclic AMP phosphodiesterase CpdA
MNYRDLFLFILLATVSLNKEATAQNKLQVPEKIHIKDLSVPDKAVNFLVLGDWGRCGQYYQQQVAKQLAIASTDVKAQFIVSTGDNFYPAGVMSIDDPLWTKSYEDVYKDFSLQIPWYVVLGNHDYKTDPDAEVAYTKKSSRWRMPARYYAVKIPLKKDNTNEKILLVFLDSSPLIDEYYNEEDYAEHVKAADTATQIKWLINTLNDTDRTIRWKFVFAHHPFFSSGKRISSSEMISLRNKLKWIFDKYKVDAYITGHEHHLEYIAPEGYTKYFISGAGSEKRPVNGKIPGSEFRASDYGFMLFSIAKDQLTLQVINWQGNILFKKAIYHL